MARKMNGGHHAALSQWAFCHLLPMPGADSIDIGCGGGANLGRLLDLCPQGHVTGIDYSPTSVATSLHVNRNAVRKGRCDVQQGDVSALPLENAMFDLACAFETIYFWPDVEQGFREVWRILKPGGMFMVCNEADGTNSAVKDRSDIVDGLTIYTEEEIVGFLQEAGFAEFDKYAVPEKGWICIIAHKD